MAEYVCNQDYSHIERRQLFLPTYQGSSDLTLIVKIIKKKPKSLKCCQKNNINYNINEYQSLFIYICNVSRTAQFVHFSLSLNFQHLPLLTPDHYYQGSSVLFFFLFTISITLFLSSIQHFIIITVEIRIIQV